MESWDVPAIRDLMLEAGKIALGSFGKTAVEHKEDLSIVTEADRAVEEHFAARLVGTDKSVHLLGEESGGSGNQSDVDLLTTTTSWVVDPIDGTAPYANGLPNWGISLGLVRDGRFLDGALFLPRTGELFITSGNEVLYERGARDPDYWRFDALAPLAQVDHPYRSHGMVSLPFGSRRGGYFSGTNPAQAIGSAVYSVAKLILGSYLAYIAGIKVWDIAGSVPILRRLGFILRFADGRDLGDTISERDWILDAASPRLYKCVAPLFIAQSEETFAYMAEHFYDGSSAASKIDHR